jgi:hypothetical protein
MLQASLSNLTSLAIRVSQIKATLRTARSSADGDCFWKVLTTLALPAWRGPNIPPGCRRTVCGEGEDSLYPAQVTDQLFI